MSLVPVDWALSVVAVPLCSWSCRVSLLSLVVVAIGAFVRGLIVARGSGAPRTREVTLPSGARISVPT